MRLHFFKARAARGGKASEAAVSPASAAIPEPLESLLRSAEVRRTVVQDTRGLVPALLLLHSHLECIRLREWERAQQRMQALSAPQQVTVEAITREIINAVLQAPLSALAVAAEDERQTMVQCLISIFNLRHSPASDDATARRAGAGDEDQPRARAV